MTVDAALHRSFWMSPLGLWSPLSLCRLSKRGSRAVTLCRRPAVRAFFEQHVLSGDMSEASALLCNWRKCGSPGHLTVSASLPFPTSRRRRRGGPSGRPEGGAVRSGHVPREVRTIKLMACSSMYTTSGLEETTRRVAHRACSSRRGGGVRAQACGARRPHVGSRLPHQNSNGIGGGQLRSQHRRHALLHAAHTTSLFHQRSMPVMQQAV